MSHWEPNDFSWQPQSGTGLGLSAVLDLAEHFAWLQKPPNCQSIATATFGVEGSIRMDLDANAAAIGKEARAEAKP